MSYKGDAEGILQQLYNFDHSKIISLAHYIKSCIWSYRCSDIIEPYLSNILRGGLQIKYCENMYYGKNRNGVGNESKIILGKIQHFTMYESCARNVLKIALFLLRIGNVSGRIAENFGTLTSLILRSF